MSCIFVHGLGQDAASWKETIRGLTINREIECPQLFELCTHELNYNNLYKAFSEYCDAHSEALDICGLSLGGMLALNYAINTPHKIHSLVLIGTQYRIPNMLMRFQNMIFSLMPQKAFDKMKISKKEIISLTKSMMNLDFEKDLRKITCPVLIMCGEKDKTNMKASQQLQNQLGTSKLKIIQNAGHEVNRDNPKLLSKELNYFL